MQDLDLLRKEISCKTISNNSKIDIMQQAVAPCPEIIMSVKGKPTRSLLNSGSEVTLINESYYKEHIEHCLVPSSGLYNNSHNLFSLRGIEEGHVPLSTKTKTATTVNHPNLNTIKDKVKTVVKLSRKRIQVKAKIPKPVKENSMIKN